MTSKARKSKPTRIEKVLPLGKVIGFLRQRFHDPYLNPGAEVSFADFQAAFPEILREDLEEGLSHWVMRPGVKVLSTRTPWGMLYDEPELVSHIMQVWREDGIPAEMPMFITESNLSSGSSETFQDIFSGVWLADYIGSFLNAGGKGVYFFHYLPLQMEPGCNSSP